MPELWFGPDGYLDLASLADGDPDSIPPILPTDELEALHEAITASSITTTPWDRFGRDVDWDPLKLGFGPVDPERGDALAAAMGGVHHDEPGDAGTGIDLDDLTDPWVSAPYALAYGRADF